MARKSSKLFNYIIYLVFLKIIFAVFKKYFSKKKVQIFTLWKDSKSGNNHRTAMMKMKNNHSNILFWTSLVCSCPWGHKESDTTE